MFSRAGLCTEKWGNIANIDWYFKNKQSRMTLKIEQQNIKNPNLTCNSQEAPHTRS